jgi:integrase
MPKQIAGLTALVVKNAKPGTSKDGKIISKLYADGDGLYLQVSSGGTKSWVYRYQIAGTRRDMGLGPVPLFSLAEARRMAADAHKLVKQDVDPIEQRHAERAAKSTDSAKAMTFKTCAEAYIAAHRTGWRSPKHAAQWPSTLQTYVYPVMGGLPVQTIDVGLVMKTLEPSWNSKPETASRVRGRIEAVLDWATARGYRRGENPARWRGHLENLLPKKSKVRRVEHHAALPYPEIAVFMAALRQQEGIAARALEFAILTAARTGEVIGMKAGREHRVPLSEAAVAILRTMAEVRMGEYVFPGARTRRPLSNTALLLLLRRMGRGDLTTHGFRSAFSDWCAEQTSTSSEVREMALAHAVSDKVEAAYRRGDLFQKRRELMAAWGRYCDGEDGGGNVVEMRRAAG